MKSFNLVAFCSISSYDESIESFGVDRCVPRQFRLEGARGGGRSGEKDRLYFLTNYFYIANL